MLTTKHFSYILLAIAILLLIPFTVMQFSNAVNWSVRDFMVMGGLLLVFGTGIAIISKNIKASPLRYVLLGTLIVLLLLIWAELAVGVIGTPFAGN